MNTNNIIQPYNTNPIFKEAPKTPRGRSLHTVDWFLNGKPGLNNHDNPHLSVRNLKID